MLAYRVSYVLAVEVQSTVLTVIFDNRISFPALVADLVSRLDHIRTSPLRLDTSEPPVRRVKTTHRP